MDEGVRHLFATAKRALRRRSAAKWHVGKLEVFGANEAIFLILNPRECKRGNSRGTFQKRKIATVGAKTPMSYGRRATRRPRNDNS